MRAIAMPCTWAGIPLRFIPVGEPDVRPHRKIGFDNAERAVLRRT